MALVDCPECARKVSSQAASCPQCGHPLEPTPVSKVQVVAEAGMAAPNSKTCPRCRKAIDPRAYRCPYCKKALRTTPATWGCLVLLILFVVMIIALNRSSTGISDAPPIDSESGMPRSSTSSPVRVICDLPKNIHSQPGDLYAALELALGAEAMLDRVQREGYWIGGANFTGGKMEIYEQDGVIDQVNIWFDPPLLDGDVLTMFGFPTDVATTDEGPVFFVWKQVFGIDRLHFLRVRGSHKIKSVMVER